MKWAIITGAAGGIGRVLAETFTLNGYMVIGIDIIERPISLNCKEYIQADLDQIITDSTYEKFLIDKVKDVIGNDSLKVLINNAAVQILGGVDSLSIKDWNKTLNVNLLVPFKLTQALIGSLEKQNGCVINISSIHAHLTKKNFVAYATSKAALSGMTRALAVDVGGRVRVNAIEPAAIKTEMLIAGFGNPMAVGKLSSCHPCGYIGNEQDVANLALAISGDSFKFMHGECISLSGGILNRLHDVD